MCVLVPRNTEFETTYWQFYMRFKKLGILETSFYNPHRPFFYQEQHWPEQENLKEKWFEIFLHVGISGRFITTYLTFSEKELDLISYSASSRSFFEIFSGWVDYNSWIKFSWLTDYCWALSCFKRKQFNAFIPTVTVSQVSLTSWY